MKIADMRKKSVTDLEKTAEKLADKITEARRERYTKEVSNVKAIKNMKRELAQIKTVIRESELNDSEEEDKE